MQRWKATRVPLRGLVGRLMRCIAFPPACQRACLPGKPKAINPGSGQSPVRQRRKSIVYNSRVCTAQRQRSQCSIRPVEMHVLVRNTHSITWTLEKSGKLHIKGVGAMWKTTAFENPTWYPYKEIITDVIIDNTVQELSDFAFAGYTNLSSIIL